MLRYVQSIFAGLNFGAAALSPHSNVGDAISITVGTVCALFAIMPRDPQ